MTSLFKKCRKCGGPAEMLEAHERATVTVVYKCRRGHLTS